MARGWESKSIEDQIDAAQEAKASRAKPPVSAAEGEQRVRRAGLMLSRTKILKDLEAARNERHREQLHRALTHLDRQLEDLDRAPGS